MQPLEGGQQVRAGAVARVPPIVVAGVDPVTESGGIEGRTQVRPPFAEERPDDASAALRDPGEPREARPAGHVQQDGLRLVIRGVRGHHQRSWPNLVRELREKLVTGDPPRLLHPLAALCGQGGDIGPPNVRLQSQSRGRLGHEARVISGIIAEGVVEMSDVQLPAMVRGQSRSEVHEGG